MKDFEIYLIIDCIFGWKFIFDHPKRYQKSKIIQSFRVPVEVHQMVHNDTIILLFLYRWRENRRYIDGQ